MKLEDFDIEDSAALESVFDWVRWGSSRFNQAGIVFGHGTSSSWEEALFLVMWSIQQPWEMFDKIQAAKLTEHEKQAIFELFKRRINERIPSPYLTGVAWFAGYPYKVTPDVLVPRSPIAELIMNNFEPWLAQAPASILDLCTGSGCIGIACAHQFPNARVDCSDISAAALEVAQKNVAFHQQDERVELIESDGFENLAGRRYDLIVSNPPYVDAQDLASMPPEFKAEPELGLTSGDDGLEFSHRLLAAAYNFLNDDGVLIAEVGNSWPALEAAYPQIPFTWPELENGGHGVFVLQKEQLKTLVNNVK